MRAWWWILITAHLVWGSPEQTKHDYKNTINPEKNENSVIEDIVYPSFILNPKVFFTGSSSEGDERDKKQMRFNTWGGKRYGDDEEEEEVEDNSDIEENVVFHEPADEDLINEIYSHFTSNTSNFETDDLGKHYREALVKRKKPSLAFSSWGGKRDPEIMNDAGLGKRSKRPTFQKNSLDSKLEMSRRRFPFFSSWAGKRAAAFNSWGGKRVSTEKRDYSRAKREYPESKSGFHGDAGNRVDSNNELSEVYTSLNSDLLDSEDNYNFGKSSLGVISEDNGHQPQEESHFLPEFDNLKRAAAFNSWGGKRISADNQVIMKKPAPFNSWAGKRAAAFNSWGGKRGAAFNSWGGKRAAAFNSWGGKRAAAFNSWGGKRAAAFNSWGGKRGAAFNSWGGKRAAAFNSWGGKRAAAFNSWGGKRAAAFNSWGGKRNSDKLNDNTKFEYPIWTSNGDLYEEHFPVLNSPDNYFETKTNELLHQSYKPITSQEHTLKHVTDNNFDKTKEMIFKNHNTNNDHLLFSDTQFTNVGAEELNNHEKDNNPKFEELLSHTTILEKRSRPSFTSWGGKRSPYFASWHGNKIPTVLLTSGKRRPAFSSWGGKRSEHKPVQQLDFSPEHTSDEDMTLQQPEDIHSEEEFTSEENAYTRKRREVECGNEKKPLVLTTERDKRAIGDYLKSRVYTRMMLQNTWPHRKAFFPWGGKRSFIGAISH